MNDQGQPTIVPIRYLVIAFLVPLAFAGIVMVLLTQAGPHDLALAGVPKDHFGALRAAPVSEASISSEEAIAIAKEDVTVEGAAVREVRLGRYPNEPADFFLSGRIIWVVSFIADESEPVFLSGPFGRDHSCDWAWHYGYVLVEVDAETGEVVSSGNGAFFDPDLPPTYERPGDGDRTYCERLAEQERKAARDSLTP